MDPNHKSRKDTVIHVPDDRKISKKCIFRVPNVLRRQNPEAYTPDVVSIGPFHYRKQQGKEGGIGEKDFQLMERVKENYLSEVLMKTGITFEELTAKVITKLSDQKNEGYFEERARSFYAEPLDISSEDFIKMMIVDGCFLVQLFRKYEDPNLRDFDDLVFNMDCMFHFLCHDILLLENQLPWFVLHSFYSLTLGMYPTGEASLSLLILKAFSILPSLKHSCSTYKTHLCRNNSKKYHCDVGVLHILDLVRASIVIPLRTIEETQERAQNAAGKEEHGVHTTGTNEADHEAIFDPDLHQIRTATDLSKADIKFKSVKRESIMDIRFEKGRCFWNGTLIIPQLNVGMSSTTLFRNLIAMEQCYYGYSNEITSYAILMDNLISSKEDMELLRKKKVIGNWMSDEDGCEFFSNLYKDIPHNKFYYVSLCQQVNDRNKLRRYIWLASLKYENFSNPWKVSAFVIASICLMLTVWSQTNNIRIFHFRK